MASSTYDIMAIKYDEVANMQNAIESYISDVESHIQKIKDFKVEDYDGVYGTNQIETINNYINETGVQINAIVRHFDDFKDALSEVQAAYESQQAAITVSEVEVAPEDAGDLININKMN